MGQGVGASEASGLQAVPAPPERAQSFQAFAARGEYEPLTLGLYALADLREVRVTLSELRSADGAVILTTANLADLHPHLRQASRVEIPGMGTIREVYDGKTAWGIPPTGTGRPEVLPSEAARGLAEMADTRPLTPAALLEVSGVGASKLARYGEEFLAEIRKPAAP